MAEARAALARHRRERRITTAQLARIVSALDGDWHRMAILEVTEGLVHDAGRLSDRHALRTYDAIHLASALELAAPAVTVAFGCFDRTLLAAARRERLQPRGPR